MPHFLPDDTMSFEIAMVAAHFRAGKLGSAIPAALGPADVHCPIDRYQALSNRTSFLLQVRDTNARTALKNGGDLEGAEKGTA